MNRDELSRLISQYHAGLDAELTLLRQLSDLAARQRAVSEAGDFPAFSSAADERDKVMRSLVVIEEGLSDYDCIVETELGQVDESVEKRLEKLLEAMKPDSEAP